MSGTKVKIVVEPSGDKKATLRLTHSPAEGDSEVSEVVVGVSAAESVREFELQMNGKLEVEVTEVIELEYDTAQMMVVEKKPPVEPQSAGVRSAPARSKSESAKEESGASSAAHHSTRSK